MQFLRFTFRTHLLKLLRAGDIWERKSPSDCSEAVALVGRVFGKTKTAESRNCCSHLKFELRARELTLLIVALHATLELAATVHVGHGSRRGHVAHSGRAHVLALIKASVAVLLRRHKLLALRGCKRLGWFEILLAPGHGLRVLHVLLLLRLTAGNELLDLKRIEGC